MLRSTVVDTTQALATLLAAAVVALPTDLPAVKSCIQRAALLLDMNLGARAMGAAEQSLLQGRFATWQANRVKAYIECKLGTQIRADDLAQVVHLSSSHFSRLFRRTFGESPKDYIRLRRVQRAQKLMLASRLSLSQVAFECGLYDQAHLCRAFRQVVGTSPAAWRRLCPVEPALL